MCVRFALRSENARKKIFSVELILVFFLLLFF
jgi:hypothetical protein